MSQLLDQMRDPIRTLHYSIRTEDSYVLWAQQFILFHRKRHPLEMGEAEVGEFLTYLAAERNVAASTQNQALSAILFRVDGLSYPSRSQRPLTPPASRVWLRCGGWDENLADPRGLGGGQGWFDLILSISHRTVIGARVVGALKNGLQAERNRRITGQQGDPDGRQPALEGNGIHEEFSRQVKSANRDVVVEGPCLQFEGTVYHVMASASPFPTGRWTPADHGTDRVGKQ